MTKKSKLLFDECVGWPAIEKLASLLDLTGDDVELEHAVRLGFGGMKDEDWIPQIANDGWSIVTGDRGRGKRRNRGDKLPIVCQRHGVTFAAFSRSINRLRVFDKIRAVMAVWE